MAEIGCGGVTVDSGLVAAWIQALGAADVDLLQRRLSWDEASVSNVGTFMTSLLGGQDDVDFDSIQALLRSSDPISDEQQAPNCSNAPFAELWQRIAFGAIESLARRLPEDVASWYRVRTSMWGQYRRVRDDLMRTLADRLSAIGQPVVWEEFNKRRTADQVILAHLGRDGSGHGPPKREIYCAFIEELRSDGLEELTRRYPVLRRHLSTAVGNWKQSSSEILTRVYGDRALLSERLGVPGDARLVGIEQGLGDPHRGGRTVTILRFASDARPHDPTLVVYKPRDVALDHAYQRLVAMVPAPRAGDRQLQALAVVRRDGYGYMEYAEHKVCRDDLELRRFYRNAGRLTAVLHLLGCSDCHYENLIACKDQLLLIDAETLFEGSGTGADRGTGSAGSGLTRLQRDIAVSVVQLGMLPHWAIVGVDQMPIDASALGIQPPEDEYRQATGWIGLNSDGMFLGSGATERVAIPTSLPVGVGSRNRLGDFIDDFCDGFASQLTSIADEKRKWIGENGLLSSFRGLTRRYVHRPTWLYFSLQQQQLEPTGVSTEVTQRLMLERLARQYLRSDTRLLDWPLFAAEVSAMNNLDIPFFEQDIEDVGLRAWKIERVFEVSGYETACRKVRELDSQHIGFQITLIRGAMAANRIGRDHGIQPAQRSVGGGGIGEESTAGERLAEVRNIGELLVSSSISDGDGSIEWLGVHLAEDSQSSIYGPLGTSLYDGKIGIAVFLAALARKSRSDEEKYRRMAVRACSELRVLMGPTRTREASEFWRDQPLGLAGCGGLLLALLHLKRLLPDLYVVVDGGIERLVEAIDVERIRTDRELDVLKGCAGLIGPLLGIGSPRARLLAQEAGRRLVGMQESSGGWILRKMSARPLTGFSHGASGMAAALARLHTVTDDREYREAAERALEYERGQFSRENLNWPDYRGDQGEGPPRFMLSWCHGAPGIALSRLCMVNTSLWNETVKDELLCAAQTTSRLVPDGDSICCGRFGRSGILRAVARDQGEAPWLGAAIRLEDQGLAIKCANGGYGFSEMLGLFRGASGVGLALLESVSGKAYDLLPSILSAGLYGDSRQGAAD